MPPLRAIWTTTYSAPSESNANTAAPFVVSGSAEITRIPGGFIERSSVIRISEKKNVLAASVVLAVVPMSSSTVPSQIPMYLSSMPMVMPLTAQNWTSMVLGSPAFGSPKKSRASVLDSGTAIAYGLTLPGIVSKSV